jgi:hypothetical protein
MNRGGSVVTEDSSAKYAKERQSSSALQSVA